VTTLRFWIFSDGDPNGLQPSPGVYNEKRFRQVDYIIYQANKNNIKLIPTLVNNWPDYGGKDQYLRWAGKNSETDQALFYTNPQIKSIFQNYIQYILSRKNAYTNIKYSDDPTILAWDIMNEPRGPDQSEMNNWLRSMAGYIKEHDPNHLVFAGTEVSYSPENTEEQSSSLCETNEIDICSMHLYLFYEKKPLNRNYEDVTEFIQRQRNYAKKVNKPLLLGEFGVPSDTLPFGKDPLFIMEQIIDDARDNDLAGYLIWDYADTQYTNFTFTPTGDTQGRYSLSDLEQILH
jgi:mannan endo-1,4-beta-mannosidase